MTNMIENCNIVMVWINQLMINPNAGGFGDPYVLPGGQGQHFAATLKIRLGSREILKNKAETTGYGMRVKFKIEKNKVAPPFKEGEFVIRFDKGGIIDTATSTFETAAEIGIVETGKGFFLWENEKYMKVDLFDTDPKVVVKLNKAINEIMGWNYDK